MSNSQLPRLAFTCREAAEMLGVSQDTIRRVKTRGELRAKRLTRDETRPGGKELYALADLQAWFENLPEA